MKNICFDTKIINANSKHRGTGIIFHKWKQLKGASSLKILSKVRRAACFSPYIPLFTLQYRYPSGLTREYTLYWMRIYSVIHQKGVWIYFQHSMGGQRKYSLISAQINWERGVKTTSLKIFLSPTGLHQENLSLRGRESCHHLL